MGLVVRLEHFPTATDGLLVCYFFAPALTFFPDRVLGRTKEHPDARLDAGWLVQPAPDAT
jgi:hypothetical protein